MLNVKGSANVSEMIEVLLIALLTVWRRSGGVVHWDCRRRREGRESDE
jgi:hypothetical protein